MQDETADCWMNAPLTGGTVEDSAICRLAHLTTSPKIQLSFTSRFRYDLCSRQEFQWEGISAENFTDDTCEIFIRAEKFFFFFARVAAKRDDELQTLRITTLF